MYKVYYAIMYKVSCKTGIPLTVSAGYWHALLVYTVSSLYLRLLSRRDCRTCDILWSTVITMRNWLLIVYKCVCVSVYKQYNATAKKRNESTESG